MTDFIDNLLTSMSSKFNEQKEVGPINLNEDKTLKWRGLHNNQYAAVKKRRKTPATKAADTPENGDNASAMAGAAADAAAAGTAAASEIVAKDVHEEIGATDNAGAAETKSNRRILRRKLMDGIPDDASKRNSSRNNKRKQTSHETDGAGGNVVPDKVEKALDDVPSTVDSKVTGRRSIRIRKSTNSADQGGQGDSAIDGPDAEMMTEARSVELPKLRRSERMLHGSVSNETKEMSGVAETKVDGENASSSAASTAGDIATTDMSKKLRKKNTDERKRNADTPTLASEAADVIDLDDDLHKYECDEIKEEAGKPVLPEEVNKSEKLGDDPVTILHEEKPMIAELDDELQPQTGDASNDAAAQSAKKRGRRPIAKLMPKLDASLDQQQQVATRSSRVKKSPKLHSDESTYTYTPSKRDKSIEQTPPQQRLSRRIKPTAKILANEELRQGFELQNNARLSLSNENLDTDIDRSPRQGMHSRRSSPNRGDIEIATASALNGSDKDEHKAAPLNTGAYVPVPVAAAQPDMMAIEQSRPAKRPCPDPEKLLSEIKMAGINLHRSPEDNKKLNVKQKKRLSKLKEKHFQRLGLQKTNKTGHSQSSSDSNAESDTEEFVPAKRINVGRPSVTLRVRGQKDIVIYDKHIMPSAKNKTKTHKKRPASPSQQQQAQRSLPPSMVSITAPALRNPEISLISSTKHKAPSQANGGQSTTKVINLDVDAPESAPPVERNLCLCAKPSKYYTKKTDGTFCSAIDQIEQQQIGCCNEIGSEMPNLLRPSVRVSYMVLCDNHRRRLLSHNCCAGCGIFCTQGKFILCQQNHFFHRDCATKFILNAVYDPSRPNYTYPTLVLKCPHCGTDAPEAESTITMRCAAAPVFVPSPKSNPRLANMSFAAGNELYDQNQSRERSILINLEKIMPDYVLDILVQAQKGSVSNQQQQYTTKDVFYAVNHNDVERMAAIIASGFDITTPLKEFHYGTCLHLVANFGSLPMAYLIFCRVNDVKFIDRYDKELRTATMCAVVGDKNDILKLLIQCGADVTLKGPDGMTALHLAAKTGNLEAVRMLLNTYRTTASISKLEKLINATDDGGWTAMVWASEVGNSEMVSAFLNCGADPNVCDAENNTALHWSTLSENIETVMMLLQAGCSLSVQNMNGDTPLHIACRNQNTRIALLLLANGASLEVTNNADEAPYDCILNENGPCGKAIFFNLQIRSITGFPKYVVVSQDISNGRELYPIKIIRKTNVKNDRQAEFDFNDQIIPDFKYITRTILFQNQTQIDRRVQQMRICSCLDNCTTQNCQCSEISVRNWYTVEGRLNADFNFHDPAMIFECNDVCGCNKMLCKNRVVQNGTRVPLQVFECDDKVKGLGVQALTAIPQGSFVAEYIGEILTSSEADRRTDDSYFFELDTTDHCIDANFYGNVSRFFNHSCVPNVVPIRVYYEHQDLRFPKIAFFASRDIQANEEITFDYGAKFWVVKYRTFRCHCNDATCRYSDKSIKKTLDEYNQRIAAEN